LKKWYTKWYTGNGVQRSKQGSIKEHSQGKQAPTAEQGEPMGSM